MSGSGFTAFAQKTEAAVLADSEGYNAWPMIVARGKKVLCAYSRGTKHDPGEPGMNIYSRFSLDNGRTWSPERIVSAQPEYGETVVAKGIDENGALLILTRCFIQNTPYRHFELFRAADDMTLEKIAIIKLPLPPMQITDIHPVPGVGLIAMWFATGYNAKVRDGAWGLAVSKDNGRTWIQTIAEKELLPDELPLEQSMVDLGNGRFLMLSRLSKEGISVQFVSSDCGMTWRKQSTNIRDIKSNTPTLHFDRETGSITCCYYQRGVGTLLRRTASADRIFEHPEEWSAPEILYHSGCTSDYDSGNANMTQSDGIQLIIFYEGTAPQTSILMISKSC